MKGALAAMISAVINLSKREDGLNGTLYLLAVGDEELGGENGTKFVLEKLIEKGKTINYAIVGEPTSLNIRIGRRGVIRLEIEAIGKQVHSARDEEGVNAVYILCDIIERIKNMEIKEEIDPYFPKTSINPTIVNCGVAPNVIPGSGKVIYDIRNGPYVDANLILSSIKKALKGIGEELYRINYIKTVAEPFKTDVNSPLIRYLRRVIKEVTGREPIMNAYGGTSDARFFAYKGIQVAEVGVDDYTLHHVDEWASIETIRKLEKIYIGVVNKLLG